MAVDPWPDEFAKWRAERDKANARERRRRQDPAYRERQRAYHRAWYAAHREERRAYHRDWMRRWRRNQPVVGGFHAVRCTNDPCSCAEVLLVPMRVMP